MQVEFKLKIQRSAIGEINRDRPEILVVSESESTNALSGDIFKFEHAMTVLHRGRDCTARVGQGLIVNLQYGAGNDGAKVYS